MKMLPWSSPAPLEPPSLYIRVGRCQVYIWEPPSLYIQEGSTSGAKDNGEDEDKLQKSGYRKKKKKKKGSSKPPEAPIVRPSKNPVQRATSKPAGKLYGMVPKDPLQQRSAVATVGNGTSPAMAATGKGGQGSGEGLSKPFLGKQPGSGQSILDRGLGKPVGLTPKLVATDGAYSGASAMPELPRISTSGVVGTIAPRALGASSSPMHINDSANSSGASSPFTGRGASPCRSTSDGSKVSGSVPSAAAESDSGLMGGLTGTKYGSSVKSTASTPPRSVSVGRGVVGGGKALSGTTPLPAIGSSVGRKGSVSVQRERLTVRPSVADRGPGTPDQRALEEQRKARERLERFKAMQEERARQEADEQALRRKRAADARAAAVMEKGRRREEIYALNVILAMSEQAFIDQLLAAAEKATSLAVSRVGSARRSRCPSARPGAAATGGADTVGPLAAAAGSLQELASEDAEFKKFCNDNLHAHGVACKSWEDADFKKFCNIPASPWLHCFSNGCATLSLFGSLAAAAGSLQELASEDAEIKKFCNEDLHAHGV
eukprot:gene11689-34414_t